MLGGSGEAPGAAWSTQAITGDRGRDAEPRGRRSGRQASPAVSHGMAPPRWNREKRWHRALTHVGHVQPGHEAPCTLNHLCATTNSRRDSERGLGGSSLPSPRGQKILGHGSHGTHQTLHGDGDFGPNRMSRNVRQDCHQACQDESRGLGWRDWDTGG